MLILVYARGNVEIRLCKDEEAARTQDRAPRSQRSERIRGNHFTPVDFTTPRQDTSTEVFADFCTMCDSLLEEESNIKYIVTKYFPEHGYLSYYRFKEDN